MDVAVFGAGYVGLVTAGCFARIGHRVSCVDADLRKVEQLTQGRIPIVEPGLDALIQEQSRIGRLVFGHSPAAAIDGASVVFLAVGTPRDTGGNADLSFVYECARSVARHLRRYTVIATKSTVPPGTGEEIEAILHKERPAGNWSVVSNPEFLREGAAIEDFMRPDRVVVGVEDDRARKVMLQLYRPLQRDGMPILIMTRRAAELVKYASNAFLAAKIAFINEIADLCEASGGDVENIALGMGLDRRIGCDFLRAGPGYGGSCFPKDTLALTSTARRFGAGLRILEAVIKSNEARKRAMIDRIVESCRGSVRGKRVALLGLTFKANTDDVRESIALAIIPKLEELGARVCAYDPAGIEQARKFLPRLRTAPNPYRCARKADVLVILTEWEEFKQLDLQRLRHELRSPVIVDLRNLYSPEKMAQQGFDYRSIGRPAAGKDRALRCASFAQTEADAEQRQSPANRARRAPS